MKKESCPIFLKDVKKVFLTSKGKIIALDTINLNVDPGELFVVLGPSGCGKTTLLNIIAGLEDPTEGEIIFGNEIVFSTAKGISLEPFERDVAMVFQSYALYPHMTVYQNIAFPLKNLKLKKETIREKVTEVAQMLRIEHLLDRKPAALSGGQKQRVAIGRALVRTPRILLMDEPLSNLDAQLRSDMRAELKILIKNFGITTVYVTHDQTEAMTLADRIAILKDGILQQVGKPDELFYHPNNIFVAGFIGSPAMNFIPAKVFKANKKISKEIPKGDITVGIRPQDIEIKKAEQGFINVSVQLVEKIGDKYLVYTSCKGHKIVIETSNFSGGEEVSLWWPKEKMYFFDKNGKKSN
ncbi:MAG: ABC transporter ATP-binding protein [Candidatus Desulfofervidaceae bacterium]|nr:ABC transporter ATP-binding protein [Candidatus Desulfofervidaceae bacterium]